MAPFSLLVLLLPYLALATPLQSRQSPPATVVADFENYFPEDQCESISNLFNVEPLTRIYKDLQYNIFAVFDNCAVEGQAPVAIAKPNGKAGLVGFSGANIQVPPASSKHTDGSDNGIQSFKPTSISMIPYIGLGQSQSAAVSGTFRIDALFADNSGDNEEFEVNVFEALGGQVVEFDLPEEWDDVVKLTITIEHSFLDDLTDIVAGLKEFMNAGQLIGGSVGGLGGVGMVVDSMKYTETCKAGFVNGPAGLCRRPL